MSDGTAAPARDAWRLFWWVLAAALFVNAVMLLVDHGPQFFIDSNIYVNSAFGCCGPSDRSFAYGRYVIRPLLWLFGSLNAVVVAQAVMAACSAAILAVILRVGFGVGPWLAAAAAAAYLAEPLSLLYQRMMMTETPVLLAYAVFLLLGILYIRAPSLRLLAGLAVLTAVCVAFRVSFLPVMIASMLLIPWLGLLRRWPVSRATLLRCATHLAVGCAMTLGMQTLYKQLFHEVTGQPPAYNSADGLILLASWAPLVTRADFPDPTLFDRIRPTLGSDLTNRLARPGQLYASDGLIARLSQSHHGDWSAANAEARRIALNAGFRDPLGVVDLGWRTYLDFWDAAIMAHVLDVDEGQFGADASLIDLFRSRYNEDIGGLQLTRTATKWWHAHAMLWYRAVLLAPLVWLAALILRWRCWRPMLLVGVGVLGLMLVDTLLVIEPVVRYLHSIAWLTILLTGVIAQSLRDLIAGHGASAVRVAGGRRARRTRAHALYPVGLLR